MYSIIKKGKFDEVSDLKFFKAFKKEVRNEDKRMSRVIDDIFENPKNTGIDFTKDLFLFHVNEAKDEQFFCITIDLQNETKFVDFLEDLLDKTRLPYNIEKEETYSYTILKDRVAIAWDKNKVILLNAQNIASRKYLDLQIETLFKLDSKNQILAKAEFKTFYTKKKDFSVWFSSNLYEDTYNFKRLEKELGYDISDNYVSAYLGFGTDYIDLTGTIKPNKEIEEMMMENNDSSIKFNSELLNYLPENTFANASLSINPLAYYNHMKKENDFDKMDLKFINDTGFSIKEALSSFKGNAIISLIGFDQAEYKTYNYYYEEVIKEKTIPVIGLAFDLNSDDVVQKMIDNLPEGKLEKRSNYYEFEFDNKYPAYFGFNKNVLLITNDKKTIKLFKDGGYKSNSIGGSKHASNFSSSSFYAYMNLDYNDYPKEIKKEIKGLQNYKEEKVFDIWNSLSKGVEVRQLDDYSIGFKLITGDQGHNSLNTLLTVIDDNYKTLMAL